MENEKKLPKMAVCKKEGSAQARGDLKGALIVCGVQEGFLG